MELLLRKFVYTPVTSFLLCRSPTEATRLRFDQEKNRLHLIHGELSSHVVALVGEAPL
jgi:hypothetical protein